MFLIFIFHHSGVYGGLTLYESHDGGGILADKLWASFDS